METLLNFLHLNNVYLFNFSYSIIFFLLLKIIWHIFTLLNQKIVTNEKIKYLLNKRNKTLFSLTYLFIVIIIWHNEVNGIITFISFTSAALTLAIREIIYNYFCGLYIKFAHPIKIEDRIALDDLIGDVINLNPLSFELLEVTPKNNQSSGKIIHIPNTFIFSHHVKNYNTAFKYIWDELVISIKINDDYLLAKEILTKIINNNETIKTIPKKAQKEINKSNSDYRIYYNKLTPIVYTTIVDNKINFNLRFLIHPKKQRYIESELYEQILEEFKKNSINFA